MAELTRIAKASELMRLLEESRILTADQLAVARRFARETRAGKMFARRLVAKGLLTRWQASQLLVGWNKLRLGKYKLCRQIGRGELGRVFLAEHLQLRRRAAIKTLSRQYMQRRRIVERFLDDARQVAALDHRNIVHVFDVDNDDDQYFLVTEYVEGRDLQRLVEEDGPLPFEVAADFVRQAAAGLAHAHALGLIHRDMRPSNLMVNESGTVKVLGLGIGSLSESSERETEASGQASTGVADYLSPEQAKGTPPVDARCDIYALGCVLYFLLTGQPPFHHGTDRDKRRQHIEGTPTDVMELRSDTPPQLAAILAKMLAKQPQDRWASAEAATNALHDWLESDDPGAAKAGGGDASDSARDFDWSPLETQSHPRQKVAAGGERIDTDEQDEPVSTASRFPPRRRLIAWAALALFIPAGCAGLFLWFTSSGPRDDERGNDIALSRQPKNAASGMRVIRERKKRPEKAAATSSLPRVGEKEPPQETEDTDASSTHENPGDAARAAKKKTDLEPAGDASRPKKAPAAKPPAEPKPDAGKSAKKPAAKRPAPKPPPLPNPFRNLPPAVDLAAKDRSSDQDAAVAEMELGSLNPDETVSLAVALIGGDTAGHKGSRFTLVPASKVDPLSWQCQLVTAEDTRTIARLELRDGQLRFQWDATTRQLAETPYLINCVLRFMSGAHAHDMRLRLPKDVEPFKMNLKKPTVFQRWRVAVPPNSQQIRCQITSIGRPLPAECTLDPAGPIALNGDTVRAEFGDESALLLEFAPSMKGPFRLECRSRFRLDPNADPVIATRQNLEKAEIIVGGKHQVTFAATQKLRRALLQMNARNPVRKVREQALRRAELELALTAETVLRIVALKELVTAAGEGAPVGFRLFHLAGDCEVDLLRAPPPVVAEERDP